LAVLYSQTKGRILIETDDDKLILKGTLNFETLHELEKLTKQKRFNVVDITQAESLDSSFAVYLIKHFPKIIKNHRQEELFKLVKNYIDFKKTEKSKVNFVVAFFNELGLAVVERLKEFYAFLSFLGMVVLNIIAVFAHPKRIRIKSIVADIELMGLKAVAILTTISFLIGAVIAYHGSIKLKQFGANIFVVDIVTISVFRELGPLLVAILLAGRSASSYTAQIAIMKVTEEIDVIKTMGIEPFDVLVFPKVVSLLISVPLLIVLADVVGVFGGMVVADISLGVSPHDFMLRLHQAIGLHTFFSGILKAPAFAILIAAIGSFKGFTTQRNVESIGKNITISVVDSIFAVIIADAIFSVLFRWMGI